MKSLIALITGNAAKLNAPRFQAPRRVGLSGVVFAGQKASFVLSSRVHFKGLFPVSFNLIKRGLQLWDVLAVI